MDAYRLLADLQLPYGLAADGRLVPVVDVERGLACGCRCPRCSRRLVAKKGPIIRHHFSHEADFVCVGAYETMAHLLAKQIIADAGMVRIPAINPTGYSWGAGAGEAKFASVEVEVTMPGMRPDIIGYSDADPPLLIEVAVRHYCAQEKIDLLRARALPAMEIDLGIFRSDLEPDALRAAVLSDAPRKWLHHAEVDRLIAEAREQLALAALAAKAEREAQAREAAAKWEAERPQREAEQERHKAVWEAEERRAAQREREYAELRWRVAEPSVKALVNAWRAAEDQGDPPPFRPGWDDALCVAVLDEHEFDLGWAVKWLRSNGWILPGLGGFITKDEARAVTQFKSKFRTPFHVLLEFARDRGDLFQFDRSTRLWSLSPKASRAAHERERRAAHERASRQFNRGGTMKPVAEILVSGAVCMRCGGARYRAGAAGWTCETCFPLRPAAGLTSHPRSHAPAARPSTGD